MANAGKEPSVPSRRDGERGEPGLQLELASAVLLGPLWLRRAAPSPWAFFPSPDLRMHTGSHTVSEKVSGKSFWTEFGRSLPWVSWKNVLVFCICREDNLVSSGAEDEDMEEGDP